MTNNLFLCCSVLGFGYLWAEQCCNRGDWAGEKTNMIASNCDWCKN